MENKEEKYVIYSYIHSVIFSRKGKIIKVKELFSYLHEWRLPKKIRYQIIKDMEKLNLIKLENGNAELNYPLFKISDIENYKEMPIYY